MNDQFNDDPELRALLDSIGVAPIRPGNVALDAVERASAERMLARIMAEKNAPQRVPATRRTARRLVLAGLVSAIVGTALVVFPWAGTRPAVAETPPLLNFALVKDGQFPAVGRDARRVLNALASRARGQRAPAALPIQKIELEGWWASSSLGHKDTAARTAVVPVHSSIYVLPSGDRRTIEHRGTPLDKHGRVTPRPNHEQPSSDTTTALDPSRGPDFPQSLPADRYKLRQLLAPSDSCGTNRGGCLLKEVSELHNNYVVDPRLRARLWAMLTKEPTVTTLGKGVDRLGRQVVALTSPSLTPNEQFIVLADPETGAYLGSETILTKSTAAFDIKPPAVIEFTALVSSRRVAQASVPDPKTTVRY